MDPASAPRERLIVSAGLVWLTPRRLLLQRRSPEAAHGADMLELPGGKVERGEAPDRALARELLEEWGPAAAALRVGRVAEVLHHVYEPPGPEVVLCVYHVDARPWGDAWRSSIELEPGVTAVAFELSELPAHEFLAADRPFIVDVIQGSVRPPF